MRKLTGAAGNVGVALRSLSNPRGRRRVTCLVWTKEGLPCSLLGHLLCPARQDPQGGEWTGRQTFTRSSGQMYRTAKCFEGMRILQEFGRVLSSQRLVGLEILQFSLQQGLWWERRVSNWWLRCLNRTGVLPEDRRPPPAIQGRRGRRRGRF